MQVTTGWGCHPLWSPAPVLDALYVIGLAVEDFPVRTARRALPTLLRLLTMNVDGALNAVGLSMELVAVFAGLLASDVGKGARRRLAEWGRRAKEFNRSVVWIATFVLSFWAFAGIFELMPDLPGRVSLFSSLVWILISLPVSLVLPEIVFSALTNLPQKDKEVRRFLAWALAFFGAGAGLQLVAVLTS